MEKETAQRWLDVGRFGSALAGLLGIILASIGAVVRITPPADGTAIYWWRASAVVLLAGFIIGAIGLALDKWADRSAHEVRSAGERRRI